MRKDRTGQGSGQDRGQNRGQVAEIVFQKETTCVPFLYFNKYNANNIVRAGSLQPAQPDGMHHVPRFFFENLRNARYVVVSNTTVIIPASTPNIN